MPHSYDYDAIVIGSGPGGEGAAMGLVKQGARVAVIERYQNVGGGCTHWGTIPSKALRHAVSRIIEFNQNPLYSDHSRLLRSSFADILNHADNVINQQTRMRQGFYERNHLWNIAGERSLCWWAYVGAGLPGRQRRNTNCWKICYCLRLSSISSNRCWFHPSTHLWQRLNS